MRGQLPPLNRERKQAVLTSERSHQYLVTEFIDGGTLKDWVCAEKRAWREIVELLVRVADGLAEAHAAGILHRDIKPDNILVGRKGYAKLADFGLAKLAVHSTLEAVNGPLKSEGTRPGIIIGTIAYRSPEHWHEHGLERGPAAPALTWETRRETPLSVLPFAGPTLSVYAFTKFFVQRNIYRVLVP